MSDTSAAEVVIGPTATLDAMNLRLASLAAGRSWRRALNRMADEIARGQPFEFLVHRQDSAVPSDLRALLTESLNAPDPTWLILQSVRCQIRGRQVWQELFSLITYPMLLFCFALAVGVWFSFILRGAANFDFIEDFQLGNIEPIQAAIEDQHNAIVGLALISTWAALILGTVYFVGPRWANLSILGGIVLIGRPLRWLALEDFLRRTQLFLATGVQPTQASQSVALSLRHSQLQIVSIAVWQRLQAGTPLGQSLIESRLSDPFCRPVLKMLDIDSNRLPESLEEVADLLNGMAQHRCQTLSTVLPLFFMLMVGTIIWAAMSTYLLALMPLVSLITSLS